ncbi:MAG: sigma-54-dependent Fis family transcriptional regulator [Candidatus Dadabacteria bacterium]|nr:sigma-54-dependent Fis family transcriptional regulator [Candidatus Dadabacteria bacterium]
MSTNITLFTKNSSLSEGIQQTLGGIAELSVLSEVNESNYPEVTLLDVDTIGIGALSRLKEKSFVIVLTEVKGARYLIESMTFGAFDCIIGPVNNPKLIDSIKRALGIRLETKGELVDFPGDVEGSSVTCAIVGNSPMLQEVCKLIGQVGRVDVPVLITGESGTGKELVAESVWKVSTRWEKTFVVLNCAAIPETLLEAELFGYEKGAFTGADTARTGKFEEADGGIMFLDEIGDMSLSLQAKVLRVVQSGAFHRLGSSKEISVNVRLITATNQNLEELVRLGKFREDLYFRINVVRIHLPPLKDRIEDIPLLMECLTRRHSNQAGKDIHGVTKKFQDKLMEYDWPGNVRELENAIRKAIAFTKIPYLTSYDLDLKSRLSTDELKNPPSFKDTLRGSVRGLLNSGQSDNIYSQIVKEAEKILLEEALSASGWNRSKAARTLGINRLTLRRKLEEYDITFP